MDKVLTYCLRGIIRYLDGDLEKFEKYRDKALEMYHNEYGVTTIEELIPDCIKDNLYETVRQHANSKK